MGGNRWFNIPIPGPRRAATASTTGEQQKDSIGVINSSQATMTFAGAPAGVTLVWKVLSAVWPDLGAHKWIAVVLSLIVGMFIYWQSEPGGATAKQRISEFVFAFINSFAIAAAVLGIDAAT